MGVISEATQTDAQEPSTADGRETPPADPAGQADPFLMGYDGENAANLAESMHRGLAILTAIKALS